MAYTLKVPMYVHVSKNKKQALNLNQYRNQHFHSSNYQKVAFKKIMASQIAKLPFFECIHIHYIIYPKVRRRFDIGNVGSIVDKFLSDALVELGKVKDDDYVHIPSTSTEFGGFLSSDDDPHVIAVISDLNEKELTDMKVQLDQLDMQRAAEEYVKLHLGLEGATTVVLTYNDDDFGAEVHIVPRLNIRSTEYEDNSVEPPATTEYKEAQTADLPVEQVPFKDEREALIEEARKLGIKGIRKNMLLETVKEELAKHKAEVAEEGSEAQDVDETSGSSTTSDPEGSGGAKSSIFESSEDEDEEESKETSSKNHSEDSTGESSKTKTSNVFDEDDETPEPPKTKSVVNRSAIFDDDD